MSKEIAVIGLIAVAGFLLGGVYSTWKTARVIAIVLALPLLGALDRASPEQVLAFGNTLITRFGIGDGRNGGEPNRYDNHR